MSKSTEKLMTSENSKSILNSSKYQARSNGTFNMNEILNDIDDRLNDIEHKINRTERKTITTRKQQIILMKSLGLFENLNSLKLSNKKLAKLLSILLNASPDNIEGDLSILYKKESALTTADNFKFLVKTFKEVGLKQHALEADKNLDYIESKK